MKTLPNARIYCSAIRSATASRPPSWLIYSVNQLQFTPSTSTHDIEQHSNAE
jgi:hypothetical protein